MNGSGCNLPVDLLVDLIITDSRIHYYDYGTLPTLPDLNHCTVYGEFHQFYLTSPNKLEPYCCITKKTMTLNTYLFKNRTI